MIVLGKITEINCPSAICLKRGKVNTSKNAMKNLQWIEQYFVANNPSFYLAIFVQIYLTANNLDQVFTGWHAANVRCSAHCHEELRHEPKFC